MNALTTPLPVHPSTQMLHLLPSQKQIEIAAFLGPTREEKIYELLARICGQITKAQDCDYQYQRCFIIIGKHLQEAYKHLF